jgi:hypothetical protein
MITSLWLLQRFLNSGFATSRRPKAHVGGDGRGVLGPPRSGPRNIVLDIDTLRAGFPREQPGQLHADAGDAEDGGTVVADQLAREAYVDGLRVTTGNQDNLLL